MPRFHLRRRGRQIGMFKTFLRPAQIHRHHHECSEGKLKEKIKTAHGCRGAFRRRVARKTRRILRAALLSRSGRDQAKENPGELSNTARELHLKEKAGLPCPNSRGRRWSASRNRQMIGFTNINGNWPRSSRAPDIKKQ